VGFGICFRRLNIPSESFSLAQEGIFLRSRKGIGIQYGYTFERGLPVAAEKVVYSLKGENGKDTFQAECRGFDSHFPLNDNSIARKELGSFY